MRPKLSIMVTRRHKAVSRLAAAIRRPMPGVLEALEKYFGEALPGGGRVFDLVADGLLRELDWLEAMDRKKYAAEEAAETLRQQVRDGAAALYAQVVSTRDSIVGAFGRAKARKLIQGRVSRNPDQLRGQAEPLVKFLAWQAADECPDAAKVEGFHPEIHHQRVASLCKTLLRAQVDFKGKEDEVAITRAKWTDALAHVDDACRSSIKTTEGLHELVGFDARLGSFRKAIRKRSYERRLPEDDEAGGDV